MKISMKKGSQLENICSEHVNLSSLAEQWVPIALVKLTLYMFQSITFRIERWTAVNGRMCHLVLIMFEAPSSKT